MKKFSLTAVFIVVLVCTVLSIRLETCAAKERQTDVFGTPAGFDEAGKVVNAINKVAGKNVGKPWSVRVENLHWKYKKEIKYVIDEMQSDSGGQFWSVSYISYNDNLSVKIVNCSYTVRAKDTWKSVAKRYKLTIKQLKSMNTYVSDRKLEKGMKIVVKKPPVPDFVEAFF